jgi:hypothetical protein
VPGLAALYGGSPYSQGLEAKLLKINGQWVFTWAPKTIFTAMKKWRWVIFLMIIVGACLDDPDCLRKADTTLVISFKRLVDSEADTAIFYNISAVGTDSIFYKTKEPDVRDTLSTVYVDVNPFAEETSFTFLFDVDSTKTLSVGYVNESRFVSEECGSERVQRGLHVLETQFDSVRVVNNILSTNRTTNIEIYH